LQSELVSAEDALAKTKSDHEYEMINQGYDELSDSLNESLESTLYELTYNASKQEEVVSNMLNNVVGMYSDAYGVIGNIISSTGIVGTNDFNNSISNIGSSSGMTNIVNDATQSQNTISSGDTTNSINTGYIGTNHSAVEAEINKAPNTDNRPVAELTIDKTSVTLEEGKSTSVSVSIRPTDAKNKTLKWTSSNTGIATVSGGTIKAIRQGSATITASTTDGSGLSKSCGVTVTPKPTYISKPTNTSTSTQGDGKVQVGDKVTFTSGRYYYDSYGTRPAGSRYQGKQVTITHINTKGSKPYHISTGSKLGSGDLGWLTQSQIKGYHTGTKSTKDELAFFDDTADGKADPGSEVIMTKYGALRQMNAGDKIFNKAQTERLWELSKNTIGDNSLLPQTGFSGYNVQSQDDHSVNLNFDAPLISIENASPDIMNQLKGKIPQVANMLAVHIKKEMRKS